MEEIMPYTADLLFDGSYVGDTAGKLLRKLNAETDAAAIAEAECMLRSQRVVAGVQGAKPPAAGVIAKDGQEFVCCIVNQPTDETSLADSDKLQAMS